MYLLAMFDLPVVTAEERKKAAKFRKFLITDGYTMMQFSVYIRSILGEERWEKHLSRIQNQIPTSGEVRCLRLTSDQFARMATLVNEPSPYHPQKTPPPLTDTLVFW